LRSHDQYTIIVRLPFKGIAQDELKVIAIELNAGGNRLMTPEDEQNAHIRERQKS